VRQHQYNFVCRLSWSISSKFSKNFLSKCAPQPKIAKKFIKTPILGVQGRSRSSMLVPMESSSAASLCLSATVLVLDWTTVAETARFEGGTQIWSTLTEDPFNLEGRTLHRWNLRLMPNISYAGCPGLCWMVSAQFTLKMCIAAWMPRNLEKFTKNPYFGGSRSSMLITPESSSAVLVMMRSKSVSMCNHSHARRGNGGKITISKGGTPLWCPRSRGISSPSGTKLSH